MRRQVVEETVKAYFDGFMSKDADVWMAAFTENAVIQDPSWRMLGHGRAEQERYFHSVVDIFDSLDIRQTELAQAGQRVMVRFAVKGRDPLGREIDFDGMDILEINQVGQIEHLLSSWDTAKVLAEIEGFKTASRA